MTRLRRAAEEDLSYEELNEFFRYDPDTGAFYRNERADVSDCDQGYRKVQYTKNGRRYWIKAHRLAVFLQTGEWPDDVVDHRDRNKGNNAWDNLRSVSFSQNMHNVNLRPNNTSGIHGVSWRDDLEKWASYIEEKKKRVHLGSFACLGKAIKARNKALKNKFFGAIDFQTPTSAK